MFEKADIFKGLSKGLIPSDAIGVDFYIKEAESHKIGGATCYNIKRHEISKISVIKNEGLP